MDGERFGFGGERGDDSCVNGIFKIYLKRGRGRKRGVWE